LATEGELFEFLIEGVGWRHIGGDVGSACVLETFAVLAVRLPNGHVLVCEEIMVVSLSIRRRILHDSKMFGTGSSVRLTNCAVTFHFTRLGSRFKIVFLIQLLVYL
jgi:hypothetical protein